MAEDLLALLMLILLQAVLGFDNLLYISIESKRAPKDKQKQVRTLGIGLAVVLRIILLFVVLEIIELFRDPFYHLHWEGVVETSISVHSLIVIFGGAFILYTAMKEVWHMAFLDEHDAGEKGSKSAAEVIILIVLMNLVFSFDSILSAIALTDVFWVMATAIVISGILMIWLADHVSAFLQKNRMFEIMGLFILFLVGVMLLSEGGHLAHIKLFGNEITAMSKTTFYFVLFFLIVSDIVQSKYQKKLLKESAKVHQV
ncbi:MAG: tellurium resistance protein TerC [Bacteroidia bacterium]|nr:tellurium resistance protein TerC [Bacteroidia bacterium]NNC84870.1 tellurium resistance protein TerC [Bacteroidia bacterium]NNM16414.1 tellurium resistance protein TerC [Bacteroidia bacterium]